MQLLFDGDVYLLENSSIGIYSNQYLETAPQLIPFHLGMALSNTENYHLVISDIQFGFGIYKDIVSVNDPNIVSQLSELLAKEGYKWNKETKELESLKPKLPKTWEEFCCAHVIKDEERFIDDDCSIKSPHKEVRHVYTNKNILPNQQTAEAFLALMQLIQLRDCYRQGWVPDYKDNNFKYYIYVCRYRETIETSRGSYVNQILSFQSKEIRDEFLTNFKDLIETAKQFI